MMDLKKLRYFVAVAELESFTAAAIRLNTAQSALSRQIANLELELGVTLFNRVGKRVCLSPAGLRLRDAAKKLLSDAENLRAIVWHEQGDISGRVCFGTDPALGDVLFPRLIERLAKTHPHVSVDPTQGLNSELQELLMRGLLDLAVLSFPDALPGCEVEPLAREPLYFVSAAANAPLMGTSCTEEEALQYPLIVAHKPHRERHQMERIAKRYGLELKIAAEVDRLPLSLGLARQGSGYLVQPHTALTHFFNDEALKLTRLSDRFLIRYLARRPSALHSPAVVVVENALHEEVAKLCAEGVLIAATDSQIDMD